MKTNQEIPTCGVLKRIARIKFPQRHPKSSTSGYTCSQAQHETESIESDVPASTTQKRCSGRESFSSAKTWVDAFEFEFDDGGESGETPCFKTTTWEL
ncbi:unnamed protein product, partial [Prunus brigantina]